MRKHRSELETAQKIAASNLAKAATSRGEAQEKNAHEHPLRIGEYVLIRDRAHRGRCKVQDFWEETPYLVAGRHYEGQPVYEVRNLAGHRKVLHRMELKHCPWTVKPPSTVTTSEEMTTPDTSSVDQTPSTESSTDWGKTVLHLADAVVQGGGSIWVWLLFLALLSQSRGK